LRQLESRLKEQILAQRQRIGTGTQKQALSKLERDFEKVQGSVQVTKSKVAKQQKQYAARGAAAAMEAQSSTQNYLQQQHAQQQLQLQQDRLQEEIMREREDEIRAINKGMHQVNQIYKDLAHIVGEQQTSVDAIETQMEDARSTAQSGLDQVHQANEKYGNSQCAIM
jgi:t-SNARE complex subunit (syntaxin)